MNTLTKDQLVGHIRANLSAGAKTSEPADIRIQPGGSGGFVLAVIWEGFEGHSKPERREFALGTLNGEAVEWADFLTPSEAQWSGSLPADITQQELPLWPEVLSQAATPTEPDPVLFASDFEEDSKLPFVVTFYSLRGGVGRSTALAYTARSLARAGKTVVCVDMDLEAPGLAALLAPGQVVDPGQGVVALLSALDRGERPDFSQHLLPATGDEERLFVVPAGELGPAYARAMRDIVPFDWYREEVNPLHLLFDGLKARLPFKPDVILCDARTGITDLSGPLLFDLSDMAVAVFFPHPQARLGTQLLTESLLRSRTRNSRGRNSGDPGQARAPEVRFIVSPLPATKKLREEYQRRADDWISGWLSETNKNREGADLEALNLEELTHTVTYQESIASTDSVSTETAMVEQFAPVAQWIQRFLPSAVKRENSSESPAASSRTSILAELSFSSATAESAGEEFLEVFLETPKTREALALDKPLVIGRKGTGKTSLFQYIRDAGIEGTERTCVVLAPRELGSRWPWMLGSSEFAEIAKIVEQDNPLDWNCFWYFYWGVALAADAGKTTLQLPGGREQQFGNGLQLVKGFLDLAPIPMLALELKGWFRRLDAGLDRPTLLLLDGLDTTFRSTQRDLSWRKSCIEGLFNAWMEGGAQLQHVHFKILLRQDLWREIEFPNKSHLFGKWVELVWRDRSEYLKVALKQAVRSSPSLCKKLGEDGTPRIESWDEARTAQAWNILLGERMAGSRTAYTRRWVWTRLADSNGDHSPRELIQLLRFAVEWERAEPPRTATDGPVVRPKALKASSIKVSTLALEAVREEFGELGPMLDLLKRMDQTPLAASELEPVKELIPLAREVGLLGLQDGSDDDPSRFRVPDLYRHALGMTRRGRQ